MKRCFKCDKLDELTLLTAMTMPYSGVLDFYLCNVHLSELRKAQEPKGIPC